MSPGPEFFQTMMGRKFYDADVPRIANALERIATAMEMLEGQVRADSLNAVAEPADSAVREKEAEARLIARQNYGKDGEIEFDDDAKVSLPLSGNEDAPQVTGAYVQAWVWVEFTANAGGPEAKCGEDICCDDPNCSE